MILAGLAILGGALNLPGVDSLTHLAGAYHRRRRGRDSSISWLPVSPPVLALLAICFSWLLYGRQPAGRRPAGSA